MKQKELFRRISEETDMGQEQVERIYYSMVQAISAALSEGEEVALIPEWGMFIPKLWDNPGMNEGSPRTRQPARYKIRFRPGKEMERKLRLSEAGETPSLTQMEKAPNLPQGGRNE